MSIRRLFAALRDTIAKSMSARTLAFASLALVFAVLAGTPALAQSRTVLGLWRAPGGSIISIHPCGKEICAQLVFLSPSAPTSIDLENPNAAQRSRALCGLQIGWGFHYSGPDRAVGGEIYDPRNGTSYHATLISLGNILQFRHNAWWHVLDNVEEWTRVNLPVPPCPR